MSRVTAMAAVALRQIHHADRDRHPAQNVRMRRAEFARPGRTEPHQLGRAAADIEQDHALRLRIEQRRAAAGGQRRFGFAIDDLELETDLLGHARAKIDAVLGRAAGLGRDQPRPRHRAVLHLVAADGERIDGALDRGVAQAAGLRQALTQTDDAGKCIDHAEAVRGRDAPPAAGSCWCQDRAQHKSRRGDDDFRLPNAHATQTIAVPTGAAVAEPDHGHGRRYRCPRPRRPFKTFLRAETSSRLDSTAILIKSR